MENPFEAASSEQIPEITLVNNNIDGSTANVSWEGNDFAMEFSYKLKYNLTDSAHLVNKSYYNWSDWTAMNGTSFNYLDEGSYTFFVKSRFDTIEEKEPYTSSSFQINNISGPALRIYPLNQTAYSGDTISVYLYFEEVDVNSVNPINLQQIDLRFSGAVSLNGEVNDLSSLLHCSTANDNPLEFLITNNQNNDFGGFDMTIIQSYMDDTGKGLCDTGPLVRIPLKVLAADGTITIKISAGQFQNYNSATDVFQTIEFELYDGSIRVDGAGQ